MAAIDPFQSVARAHDEWRIEAIAAPRACMVVKPQLAAEILTRVAD